MVLNRLLGFDVHDDWRHQLLNGLASSWDHCRCRIRCVLLYSIPGQPHRIADPRFLLFDPVLLGDHPATGVSTSSTIRAPHLRETLVFYLLLPLRLDADAAPCLVPEFDLLV